MSRLGATCKDKITGFVGVVTGEVKYLSGCDQALLVPKVKDDGTLPDSQWFDVQRLTEIGSERVTLDNAGATGPDREPPKR